MDNLQHWPETQEHLKHTDLIFNIWFNISNIQAVSIISKAVWLSEPLSS